MGGGYLALQSVNQSTNQSYTNLKLLVKQVLKIYIGIPCDYDEVRWIELYSKI